MSGLLGILIFSGTAFGGVERRFARLGSYLLSQGVRVNLYCTADAWKCIEKLGIQIPPDRLRIIDRPSGRNWVRNKWNRLTGLARLLRMLKKDQVNHVHLAMGPGLIAVVYGLMSRWLPPYSLSVMDPKMEHWPGNAYLRRTRARLSMRNAAAVDCLSESLRNATIPLVPKRLIGRVLTSPCSFTDLRRTWTAENRDIDVLFMARFREEKGLDLLERTMTLMKAQGLDGFNLHVCGGGPIQPDIPQAEIYSADDSFAIMARAKIFLSIQRLENYPSQSLLEAMGSRCAIIATDVGETRRLIDDSCAVLVPYESGALSDAISRLLSDPSLQRQLGDAAHRRVHETQSVERFAKYFKKSVVGGHCASSM